MAWLVAWIIHTIMISLELIAREIFITVNNLLQSTKGLLGFKNAAAAR
jgi:hypothetical protein